MQCRNMLGKTFDSLQQRMVFGYLSTFLAFRSTSSAEVDEQSQRQMYDFLWDLVRGLYADPGVLAGPVEPDEWFGDWALNNSNPDLDKRSKRAQKELVDLYTFLQAVGERGALEGDELTVATSALKPRKKYLQVLDRFGVQSERRGNHVVLRSSTYPRVFPAWRLLARVASESPADTILVFSRALFVVGDSYMVDLLSSLHEPPHDFFPDLDQYLRGRGYEARNGTGGYLAITYLKDGERRFTVQSDPRRLNQMHYPLRLSKFRRIWERAEELDPRTRRLLWNVTRTCSGCGGCKRTKFTDMGPFQKEYEGETRTLCPWYPNSEWHWLDADKIAGIKALLDLQEKVLVEG